MSTSAMIRSAVFFSFMAMFLQDASIVLDVFDEPDRVAIATIVLVHEYLVGIEGEIPCVVGVVVGRRRPVETVGPHIISVTIAIAATRGGQQNRFPTGSNHPIANANPYPLA